MQSLQKQFKGKKVLIVGLGLQGGGVGLVRFFSELGAQVRATDLKTEKQLDKSLKKVNDLQIELSLEGHKLDDFLWADVIFKGPSVPWNLPYLQKAMSQGIPVEMEASFFASHCSCAIIGITGTRGKSTTTMMIYEIMKQTGFSVFLAGNIPDVSTIALFEKVVPADYVVLELSSWQLSGFHRKKISPHIGVITNFYPDHLNYYKTLEDYWYDKTALYLYQKKEDVLIIDHALQYKIDPVPLSTIMVTHAKDFQKKLEYLQGRHNYENASQALAVGRALHIDQSESYKVISQMKPLVYRMSKIATLLGIDIYNDSTATTPIACQKAISALAGKDITLILGGNSKNLPYDFLAHAINKIVKRVILLKGSFTDEIQPMIEHAKIVNTVPFGNLQSAFHQAVSLTEKTGIILFSPGATSFAMFENEFHRGGEFTKIVKEYEKENKL